jgi:hypothetical protein
MKLKLNEAATIKIPYYKNSKKEYDAFVVPHKKRGYYFDCHIYFLEDGTWHNQILEDDDYKEIKVDFNEGFNLTIGKWLIIKLFEKYMKELR